MKSRGVRFTAIVLGAAACLCSPAFAESYSAIDSAEGDSTPPPVAAPVSIASLPTATAQSVQVIAPAAQVAAEPAPKSAQTLYYYSTARLTSLVGPAAGMVSNQNVLLKRTLDPIHSMIIEIACYAISGKGVQSSPVYMQVSGNKITAMADNPDFDHPGRLSGTGTLAGNDWDWNHLTFSMKFDGASIEDSNFLIHRKDSLGNSNDLLIGRKQIFAADGSPVQLYDLEMNQISEDQFQFYSTQMKCPN